MEKKGTILIVDDELGPRESLRMILKPLYEIYTAANGQEALKCIRANKVDVVTLDLTMPGMSGLEVLQSIKKSKANVEVIIVTAGEDLKNIQQAINYGAGDFITKPFDVAEIITAVTKSFERRKYNQGIKGLIQHIKDLGIKPGSEG